MYNLVIDEGNTASKFGLFKGVELIDQGRGSSLDDLERFVNGKRIARAILSSVKSRENSLLSSSTEFPLEILDHQSRFPIKIKYDTPETLGIDRIISAVGALAEFPKGNLIVVDMGTCITADLVVNGTFQGGWILPGINMQMKAMHEGTDNLPLLEIFKSEKFELIGTSTEGSMKSGVVKSVNLGLEGFLMEISKKYQDLNMVVTGGDLNQLETNLKDSIFARPNLNLTGLNRILMFHEEVG